MPMLAKARRKIIPSLLLLLTLPNLEAAATEKQSPPGSNVEESATATKSTTRTSTSYGVDCSFPMHTLDFEADNRCGTLLGDRTAIYNEFMEGCREKFGYRCDQTEESRVEQMFRQVPSLRNYTDTGYSKLRAPAEMFELISQHWLRNTQKVTSGESTTEQPIDLTIFDNPKHVEVWTKGHTYVNYWDHNTTYFGLSDDGEDRKGKSSDVVGGSTELHDRLLELARPVLEEWTGMELQSTSLYGIRIYREGAILSPHVDRNPLVASAIINVAQDPAMTDDWPLEVIDRQGNAVNISMVPGDMVLYESGTLIHARPFALQGKYYANVFCHFEPTGRRLKDVNDPDMVYDSEANPAGYQNGVRLPPYIIPGSDEALNFIDYNPYGWGFDDEDFDSDSDEDDDEGYSTSNSEDDEDGEEYSTSNSDDEYREEYRNSDGSNSDEDDEELEEGGYSSSDEDHLAPENVGRQANRSIQSPNCPSHVMEDSAQAPSECRSNLALYKKIFSGLNQLRKKVLSQK